MAKSVDAGDLKSPVPRGTCGFEPRSRHGGAPRAERPPPPSGSRRMGFERGPLSRVSSDRSPVGWRHPAASDAAKGCDRGYRARRSIQASAREARQAARPPAAMRHRLRNAVGPAYRNGSPVSTHGIRLPTTRTRNHPTNVPVATPITTMPVPARIGLRRDGLALASRAVREPVYNAK